jgi:hypothetical protein
MEDVEIKAGGFVFRGWYIAAALPVLSGLSGGIYYGYDAISRFNGLEESVTEVLDATSRRTMSMASTRSSLRLALR